ncbi:MAG TPA: GNAT family N-acetyltransferase [Terracidiphilus sp.]|jgi:ribosomal protein S18 acetylase RimI-like enzyme
MISYAINAQTPKAPNVTDRIEIRRATDADNEALLALTRATPMGGRIALRIDREPDFFALLRARGEAVVYVATYQREIIGCLSAAIHRSYVRGTLESIAHVGDMKVHPQFRGRGITLRLIATLQNHLQREGVDVCFSLVADGNKPVMTIAEGKHGTPAQVQLGRFFVDELIPSAFRSKSREYIVEPACTRDLPEIAAILDCHSRKRNFSPSIDVDEVAKFIEPSEPTTFRQMLVARQAGLVVATLTMEDTRNLRQNVLVGLPPSLRVAVAILRVLAFPIPGFSVPHIGGQLSMLYVRLMACADGCEQALRPLIAEARAQAYRRRFTFLSVGLHERDPLRFVVQGIPRFTFTSRSMATSSITPDRVKSLVGQIPYEDFALV